MTTTYGPEFTRFFPAIVKALREMGGSGTTSEVIDRSIELLGVTENEQSSELASGSSRIRNQAQWARLYMARGGILDSSKRGIWRLTEAGNSVDPSVHDWRAMFRSVQKTYLDERKQREESDETPEDDTDDGIAPADDYRSEVLTILRRLPPSGFEKLCQNLLRESGFQQVTVTGKSGDGGIDGIGILQVNAFVSFNVLFQCKRYAGLVTPSQIRDFRGAMVGRADKGLVITTGTFTVEAKREARRDGAPPIELVDGEALVRLFESLEFGLLPRTTYDVDTSFFHQFQE
ncbi:MAG: restriction endonuclease [Planctomycetota bacterium]